MSVLPTCNLTGRMSNGSFFPYEQSNHPIVVFKYLSGVSKRSHDGDRKVLFFDNRERIRAKIIAYVAEEGHLSPAEKTLSWVNEESIFIREPALFGISQTKPFHLLPKAKKLEILTNTFNRFYFLGDGEPLSEREVVKIEIENGTTNTPRVVEVIVALGVVGLTYAVVYQQPRNSHFREIHVLTCSLVNLVTGIYHLKKPDGSFNMEVIRRITGLILLGTALYVGWELFNDKNRDSSQTNDT